MGLSTTPRTWVAGETVTAAMMNTEIRDNMNALGAGTIMGTPASTSSGGTSTSGTTETRDAVLGNFTFTAVAGRRYVAVLNGFQVYTTVANDIAAIRIRNGGSSTPTTASTQVALTQGQVAYTGAGMTFPVAGSFVPGAGTVTLSAFTQRVGGTGVLTPNTTTRELYAVDIGPA